jgi:hypothetical protein
MVRVKNARHYFSATLRLLKGGINKHLAGRSFLVDNEEAKADEFTARIDAFDVQVTESDGATVEAKKLRDGIVKAQTEMEAEAAGWRRTIIAMFGPYNAVLSDFGITPRKKPVRSVDNKKAANEKAKATREARHTVGPKEKAKIKGTVPTPSTSGNNSGNNSGNSSGTKGG